MVKIQIKKLAELSDALHPGNIEVGYDRSANIQEEYFQSPIVGKRFYVGFNWSTSIVKEIIDDKTFRTQNSIYKWEASEFISVDNPEHSREELIAFAIFAGIYNPSKIAGEWLDLRDQSKRC